MTKGVHGTVAMHPTTSSLLDRVHRSQLLLNLLEWAEDERLVVRAAAPQDADELNGIAARYAEDGGAAVALTHDARAAGVGDERLAQLRDVRAGDGRVHAGARDGALRPARRPPHFVHDRAEREVTGGVVLRRDREDATDGEAAVVRAGRLEDVTPIRRDAARVQRAGGVAIAALLPARARAAAEVARVGCLGGDHRRIGGARRLVVLRSLDAALRVSAVRVRDEGAAAAVVDVEAHRAQVLAEVDLDAGLRGTPTVAKRRHLVDGRRHLDREGRRRNAEP